MGEGGPRCEIAWFGALCDDDYEFLGVPDPDLRSSWEHCRDIVLAAEASGFDNVLLPSGYALGVDSTAFAAGIAPATTRIQLLLAVRMGEMWPPQLARQLATIDRMASGRLTVNIISSDLPGESLDSEPRYARTREYMQVVRALLDGQPVDRHQPLYWQFHVASSRPKVALRDGDWKLLAFLDGPQIKQFGDIRDQDQMAIKTQSIAKFELYNLAEDIGETRDRAADQPQRLERMAAVMRRIFKQVQQDSRGRGGAGPHSDCRACSRSCSKRSMR